MPPIGEIDTKDNAVGKTEAHIANCNMSEKSTSKEERPGYGQHGTQSPDLRVT